MVVAVIAGEEGTGKTSQLFTFAKRFDNTAWAYWEAKDTEHIEKLFDGNSAEFTEICAFYPIGHKDRNGDSDAFEKDPYVSLHAFQVWRDSVVLRGSYNCLVIDGISDIRKFAIEEWKKNNPIFDEHGKKRERIGIKKENKGAWGDINTRVRRLLVPLVTYGTKRHVHVFFTAQMKDVYVKGERVGVAPDIKDFLAHDVGAIFVMKNDEKYTVTTKKIPAWANKPPRVIELDEDVGLFNLMAMCGILDTHGGQEK